MEGFFIISSSSSRKSNSIWNSIWNLAYITINADICIQIGFNNFFLMNLENLYSKPSHTIAHHKIGCVSATNIAKKRDAKNRPRFC